MTTERMTMNEWKLSFKFLRQHHMKILFHVIYLTFPADLAAASSKQAPNNTSALNKFDDKTSCRRGTVHILGQ
jgi:hypothetical protein